MEHRHEGGKAAPGARLQARRDRYQTASRCASHPAWRLAPDAWRRLLPLLGLAVLFDLFQYVLQGFPVSLRQRPLMELNVLGLFRNLHNFGEPLCGGGDVRGWDLDDSVSSA
jgi:hypothetical protein